MKLQKLMLILCVLLINNMSLVMAGENIETILSNLSSSDRSVRVDAVRELRGSEYRSQSSIVEPLIHAMRNDSDSLVREYAADILAENTEPAALAAVIETLSDPQYSRSHEAASDALRYVRSAGARPALMSGLRSSDRDVRRNSAVALGTNHISDSNVVAALKIVLNNDREELVREYTGEALAKLPAEQAVSILSDSLASSSSLGREQAAKALRNVRSPMIMAPLLSVINDSDREIRQAAIRSLNNYGDRQVVFDALYSRFSQEPDSYTKELMFDLMTENSDARMHSLASANLTSSNHSIQRASIRYVNEHGNKNDLVPLIGMLSNSDEIKRGQAYDAIRAIIGRLQANDPLRIRVSGCMPKTSSRDYSQSTREAALVMDLFLGTFGMFTVSAHGKRRIVQQLSPAQVQSLQALVQDLISQDAE